MFLGPDSTICANVNVTPQNELIYPLTLGLDLGGGGVHRRCVTAMDRSAQCSVSVYVYERNNVKLTDLPANKHRNVTVKEYISTRGETQ